MIVGVVGYGCTGASAYVDYLKELGVFQHLKNASEFQLLKMADGIIDLYYHLVVDQRSLSQNAAINRFLNIYKNPGLHGLNKLSNGKLKKIIKEYVDNLCSLTWDGRSSLDPVDIRRKNDTITFYKINAAIDRFLRMFSKKIHFPRYKKRYYTQLNHKDFCKITKNFIQKLLNSMGFDVNRNILLEQIVDASFPELGLDFFDDCKIIVVDRDPRDVYLLKNYIYKNSPAFIPTNNSVNEFIQFYKMQRNNKSQSNNILYVYFEDLIYKYEETTNKICKFLEIENDNPNKLTIFNPANSIANCNLSSKYVQYSKEISLIENKLKDYIYNFDIKTSIVSNGLKPFNENKRHA